MSNTDLNNVGGYTPVIDSLVSVYGVTTALVFGKIWRYCNGEYGICFASKQTIADDLGLCSRTVQRHIKILVQDDFIKDITPERRNRPHSYKDTGKANYFLGEQISPNAMTESPSTTTLSHNAMTENSTDYDLESGEDSTKKEVKKEENIEKEDMAALSFSSPTSEFHPLSVFAKTDKKPGSTKKDRIRDYIGRIEQDPNGDMVPALLSVLGKEGIPNKSVADVFNYARVYISKEYK